MPQNPEYDKLYIRKLGSSDPFQEFPYSIEGSDNSMPETDVSTNDVDLDSYTNTKGRTIRKRVRDDVASFDFSIPTWNGQELHTFYEETKDVWFECYFFYEPDWKFVLKKMYRSGTVKFHRYYIDKTNPLKNIYTDIQFSIIEE